MLVVPAVDLLDGCVARVEQGDLDRKTVYSDDPLGMVRNFASAGAKLVHIVDLNAAVKNDSSRNRGAIYEILSARLPCGIQLAGGIRSNRVAREFLESGAHRIVLSSIVYSEPQEAYEILQTFGSHRIVLALDYDSSGMVRTSGWSKGQHERVFEAVPRLSRMGFDYFLTTSIKRDGLLGGPDYETLRKLRLENPPGSAVIIASGGISSQDDIDNLAKIGMDEAVVGKAIYEKKVSLKVS